MSGADRKGPSAIYFNREAPAELVPGFVWKIPKWQVVRLGLGEKEAMSGLATLEGHQKER